MVDIGKVRFEDIQSITFIEATTHGRVKYLYISNMWNTNSVNAYIKKINSMKSKFRILLMIGLLFQCNQAISQLYIGKWEHINNENEKVIIEFMNNSEYKISIPKRNIVAIERQDGLKIDTNLKYTIDSSTKPAKIDIVSGSSGKILRGIIEFIDAGTIQMQINPIPNGERPQKFIPDSENYIKGTRTFESTKTENI